ncbi:MAG TPA: CARDB domain-containing protein, partial [Candidatus Limnocylindria bacterium]|nr:CARDB domain-containing protein [Candidatus Limnocylindria bacterium]
MQTRFQRRWSAYGFTRWLCLLLLGAGGLLHARADPGGFIRLLSPGDQIPPGPGVDWGSVEFRWEAVSWAASYKLTLHQLETGQAVEYPVEGAPTSFTVSLTSGTSYFWQLTAYTGAGQTGTAVGSQAEYFRAGFELGKCDLYVRALDLPPDPVVAGQNLSVLYHVRNAGAGNSVATKVLLQIERADGSIYLQKEADLPAMAAVSFDFAFETVFLIPADVPTGTYSVRVLLDTPDLNRETDKDNNTYFAANALKLQAITANLTPYQSAGWDDKLVLAKTKGAT